MILRRFTKHVTEQNWFAVGLDVVVVITGIFLGIQVADLNENRKDRIEEQRILVALKSDTFNAISTRRVQFNRIVKMRKTIATSFDVLFELTEAQELSKEQCLAIGMSHIIGWQPLSLVSVDELITAGKFNIIRNNKLRLELLKFKQTSKSLDSLNVFTASQANQLIDQFPLLLPRYWTKEHTIWNINCLTSSMKKNQEFINKLISNYGRSSRTEGSLKNQLGQLERIKTLLQ